MSEIELHANNVIYDHVSPMTVSRYVGEFLDAHEVELSHRSDGASLRHQRVGAVDYCQLRYGNEVRVTTPGLREGVHLQVVLQGLCTYAAGGRQFELGPGDAFVIGANEPVDLTYSRDCEKLIVRLPLPLLDEVCSEHRWQRPVSGFHFAPTRYQQHELGNLFSLMSLVCTEAEQRPDAGPMLWHYNRIVAAKLLSATKCGVMVASAPSDRSMTLDRIRDYIESNLHRDIEVAELSQVARMSVRSLYGLFDRHLGTSPKCYIKERKLARVRAALTDEQHPAPSVTAVALSFGFSHLGRFAKLYKQRFGERPSETLQRQGRKSLP